MRNRHKEGVDRVLAGDYGYVWFPEGRDLSVDKGLCEEDVIVGIFFVYSTG